MTDILIDLDSFFPIDNTPEKCRKCEYAYYMYGVEFNCALTDNGKKCKFKKREEK